MAKKKENINAFFCSIKLKECNSRDITGKIDCESCYQNGQCKNCANYQRGESICERCKWRKNNL